VHGTVSPLTNRFLLVTGIGVGGLSLRWAEKATYPNIQSQIMGPEGPSYIYL